MGKITERKSESWKPAVVQDTGSISKNKKRKEKRLSKSLIAANLDSTEASPAAKKALGPLNKIKKNANVSLKLTPKGKKENAFLSTSLPIKGDKKSIKSNIDQSFSLTPSVKHAKNKRRMSEMISSSALSKMNKNTPKKGKANVEEFIDSEAEEGEEPINNKEMKPYEKGSKNKSKNESSDDESVSSSQDFLDMEASEGEETDSEVSNNAENDTDDSDDDSDGNTNLDMSDFIVEDDENEEDDSSDNEDDEEKLLNVTKSEPQQKKKIVKNEKENIPMEKSLNNKQKKRESKMAATETEGKAQTKNAKKMKEDKSQLKIMNGDVNANLLESKDETKNVKNPTKFVGFVRGITEKVSKKQLKGALCTKIDASKIVQIEVKKDKSGKLKNNFFIYVADEESLAELLNHKFTAGETAFVVYKARESTRSKEAKPIAFMPRVPLTITDDQIKEAVEKETSKGSVVSLTNKRVNDKFQNRNVIIRMSDIESLKKIITKGACTINETCVVVREAFEAGLEIPTYRVVFSLIPSKTTELVLKKAIESKVGKGSVSSIRFSARKDTFAFVVFENEEAKKKALDADHSIAINGVKLQSSEFNPRYSKKRGPRNENAKTKKAEKRKIKKQMLKDGANTPSPKKIKQDETNIKKAASSKKTNESESPTGKGKQSNEKKKNKKVKHFQHEKAKVQSSDKKKVLSEKIQAKKKNLNEKKKKKKSLNTSK